jgi:hypothetical protein
MDGLEALVLIVFAMVPVTLRFIARYYRLREKELRALGTNGLRELERLRAEKRALEERVETLESIVCTVDFDLERRLHRAAAGPTRALEAAARRRQRRSERRATRRLPAGRASEPAAAPRALAHLDTPRGRS